MRNTIKKIILYILTLEAKLVLARHKPFVIGITGNIGKTTTKDTVAAALSGFSVNGRGVRESKKSMNSEWGIPLTILDQKSGWDNPGRWLAVLFSGFCEIFNNNYPKILILEIGADHKGDIKSLMKWIKLDIGVMTQFAEVPVHIENFKNREEMILEKSYLAKGIKNGGTFIYNSDCKDTAKIASDLNLESKQNKKIDFISFGKKSGDCRASVIISDIKNKNVHSQVIYQNKNYNLTCDGVIGESNILCALPAIIIGKHFEKNEEGNALLDFKSSLENIKTMYRAPGRMKILEGKSNSIIIDDSYNSSPLAVMHGLKTIGETNVIGRKIVMLGDMLELGDHSKDEHIKIGKEAARVAHVLVTVGDKSRFVAEGALNNGMNEGWILECDDSESAGREVLNILKSGDLIYIKGSQGMRMERATKILVHQNVKIKYELPRQEKEWENKK